MELTSPGGTHYEAQFKRGPGPMTAAERAQKQRVKASLYPEQQQAARAKDAERKRSGASIGVEPAHTMFAVYGCTGSALAICERKYPMGAAAQAFEHLAIVPVPLIIWIAVRDGSAVTEKQLLVDLRDLRAQNSCPGSFHVVALLDILGS